MRIGVDARELQGHPTGTGRYLRNLLRAWPEGDTFLLYFNGAAPAAATGGRPDVELRSVGDGGRGLVWQEQRLPTAVHADRLDVFWAPAYFCPLGLAVPRVTSLHDLSFFSLPHDFPAWEGARRRWLVSRSVAASARLLTISDFTAREIAAYFPMAASRTVAIPLAADADLPPAPPRDEARRLLDVRGPMLLSVGSILNRRNLPALLTALRAVARHWPSVLLDVVGDNRTAPRLDFAAMARELGLDTNVRLSGFVSDEALALRYAAADAAVYLSEYEGFGLPVIESMARGLPVLTSRRPATGELFADSALLSAPDDPREIARGLLQILGDDGLRAELARRGRTRAASTSWTEIATRTRAVLAEAARA